MTQGINRLAQVEKKHDAPRREVSLERGSQNG